jgi:hypothetical protein
VVEGKTINIFQVMPIVRMDKTEIQRVVAQQNAEMGILPDLTATVHKARELMLALGIRPEDDLGSCGILSAREE